MVAIELRPTVIRVRVRVLEKTLWEEVVRGEGRPNIVTVGREGRVREGGSHGGDGRVMGENLGRWWLRRRWRLRCGVT